MVKRTLIAALVALMGASVVAQQKPARTPKTEAAKPEPQPASASTPAPKGMTNDDVIQMVQGGLGESVVLAAIRTAKSTAFDISPTALLALKKSGVSDAIVSTMIDPKSAPTPSAPAVPVVAPAFLGTAPANGDARARIDSPTASPEIPRDPGIYWDKGRDGAHDLTVLEPTVFSQAKTGGFFKSAMTYGIAKINWKAVVRGSAAARHIDEPRPVFFFYFENRGSGLGNTGGFAGWLSNATSPNEFVLVRMKSKSTERELIVGEIGAFGGSSGTRSKDTVDVQIERLSGGIYRVTPAIALEDGEYCFFYAGGMNTLGLGTGSAGKLFDFGIYKAK